MKRRVVVFLAALTVGCGDIGAPLRSDLYEYRVTSPGDTTAFTWPRDSMPIRIWSEDTFDFPMHLANAIAAWNDVFLYREFRAVPTDDSLTAHVILRAGVLPPGDGSPFVRLAECEGVTEMDLDFDNKTLSLPMRVFVNPRFSPALEATRHCFGVAILHELGHVMGMLRHSPRNTDIMFASPEVDALSERDRNTAEVMYHAPSNVVLLPAGSF